MKSFFEFCQLLKKEQVAAPGVPEAPAKPVDPTKLIPQEFISDLEEKAKKTNNPVVKQEIAKLKKNLQSQGIQTVGSVK